MNKRINSRKISNTRAEELKRRIDEYLDIDKRIETGLKLTDSFAKNKEKIKTILNATEEDWNSWKWQVLNRISDIDTLSKILDLTQQEIKNIELVGDRYRWTISPYYASLMDNKNSNCPIRMQAIPNIHELEDGGKSDPMGEEYTSPVKGVTRRYPDRLILKVTTQCAMYCRHCQRRRNIGELDRQSPRKQLEEGIRYIKEHEEIRDVLLTGGDALMISNKLLEWILIELRKIPHVEIIRIGSRTLVTMPQRITDKMCKLLEEYHPVYLNTHFNHPKEITTDVVKAADRLSKAGIPLGNQTVLLKGINDDYNTIKKLNQELLKVRIKPYYIFHPKSVMGTMHFKVKVQQGIEIMEKLRGYTSGMAIPTYIINAPGGYGKTPIQPNYIISWGNDHVKIRTWEGKIIDYPN